MKARYKSIVVEDVRTIQEHELIEESALNEVLRTRLLQKLRKHAQVWGPYFLIRHALGIRKIHK